MVGLPCITISGLVEIILTTICDSGPHYPKQTIAEALGFSQVSLRADPDAMFLPI